MSDKAKPGPPGFTPAPPRPAAGFTLTELMVTLAVFGILLGVGVPGLNELTQRQRVSTHANALVAALQLARSEAVRRGAPVSVSAVGDGFATGWCVHVDEACERGTALSEHPAIANLGIAASASRIGFDGRGARVLPATDDAEIALSPPHCVHDTMARARVVSVGLSGRASISRANCS